jgi:ADP-heptose:LPS heptosyltransferase
VNVKSWEKRGKRGLARALGRAFRVAPDPGPRPDFSELSRILLVRTQNQLGDFLLGTPAIRAVRERAPHARIDLLVATQNAAPAIGNERVDDVLVFDKRACARDPRRARALVARLKQPRYDLALVISSVDSSVTATMLAALSGAARRAGRAGAKMLEQQVARDFFHWVLDPPLPSEHQTSALLGVVRAFGADSSNGMPEMFPTPAESARGSHALDESLGATGEGLRVVLHPGAGKRPNRWPAERFGAVAVALRAAGHRVAAVCGPGERELLDALDRGAGERIPRLPSLTIRELAGALARADLLVANDTGVLHVGAAAGANALGLFGPTDPLQWCPASPRVFFVRAPGEDLERLPADLVVRLAGELARHLAGKGARPEGISPAPTLSRGAAA